MTPRLLRLLLPLLLALPYPLTAAPQPWREKVDPWVLEATAKSPLAEFLLTLEHQADLRGAAELTSKAAKGRFVVAELRRVAADTQPAVLKELEELGVEYRPYWVANMIWVLGDAATVRAMAERRDVHRVTANPEVKLRLPRAAPEATTGACLPTVEGSLAHVEAPDFWDLGITGGGAVVAGADTGYDWDHPALRDSYRGWNGAVADHSYNWHDAIHSGGGSCGADSPEPCDDNGHGTHTMGTMVGDDGASRIGMAPGARWIGCRNMNQGNGTPATYTECFEFFIAPTDSNDMNPDPGLAPHVINNSWSCPPSEGCTDPEILLTVVENTRAAGIAVVVAAGNSGSECSTVSSPSTIYDAAFSIGAVDNSDLIASFSSRGPVTVDGSDRMKPDVTAPGENICSSVPGGGYSQFSGTSMASPHVAGLVALLIAAQPCLAGNVDAIEQYVRDTAVARTTTQTCGGVPGSEVPNNTYGFGAIRAVLPGAAVCGALFVDGFESGDTMAWSLP